MTKSPNQIIHEAMGLCWHEYVQSYSNLHERSCWKCTKCTEEIFWIHSAYSARPENPDYSKWEHYGPMLEEFKKKEYWLEFCIYVIDKKLNGLEESEQFIGILLLVTMLNPVRGRDAIAEFLKERA